MLPTGAVRVEAVLSPAQAAKLVAAGVPLIEKQVGGTSASQRMSDQSAAGYEVFRSLERARRLAGRVGRDRGGFNPGLVKQVTIGKSVQGQDILAFKVTRDANWVRDGRRPAVLYSSNQHARSGSPRR